eukprot:g31953.t1
MESQTEVKKGHKQAQADVDGNSHRSCQKEPQAQANQAATKTLQRPEGKLGPGPISPSATTLATTRKSRIYVGAAAFRNLLPHPEPPKE